jgi:multiple sugar transport system permease protein
MAKMNTTATVAHVASADTRRRVRKSALARHEERWALLFLLPSLLGLLLFTLGPIIASFVISFFHWDLLSPPRWLGLRNYQWLFAQDQIFPSALVNTVYYTFVSTPVGIVIALLLALAMNQKIKGIVIFRSIYFIPVISSGVAVALIWSWIYNPNFGIANWFLGLVGLPQGTWLANTSTVMPSIIAMAVWQGLGYNMVIFLAGLQGIDQSYYEAATMDGANALARFWHITVPLLSPTTFFIAVIGLIGGFQVFVPMFVMTNGGPGTASTSVVEYIFDNAFRYLHMGLSSAAAWVLFAVVFVFTLLQLRMQQRWVHYD